MPASEPIETPGTAVGGRSFPCLRTLFNRTLPDGGTTCFDLGASTETRAEIRGALFLGISSSDLQEEKARDLSSDLPSFICFRNSKGKVGKLVGGVDGSARRRKSWRSRGMIMSGARWWWRWCWCGGECFTWNGRSC